MRRTTCGRYSTLDTLHFSDRGWDKRAPQTVKMPFMHSPVTLGCVRAMICLCCLGIWLRHLAPCRLIWGNISLGYLGTPEICRALHHTSQHNFPQKSPGFANTGHNHLHCNMAEAEAKVMAEAKAKVMAEAEAKDAFVKMCREARVMSYEQLEAHWSNFTSRTWETPAGLLGAAIALARARADDTGYLAAHKCVELRSMIRLAERIDELNAWIGYNPDPSACKCADESARATIDELLAIACSFKAQG